jgi:hypothetical protein
MGIETFYPHYPHRISRRLLALATTYDLLVTGGSDFHGANVSGIDLGKGRGGLNIPHAIFEQLKHHWEEKNRAC